MRKHKKIENSDLNIIDYVSSIIRHEMTHVALLNIGESSSTSHRYDNIARFIEERDGFPKDFFDEFDYQKWERDIPE